MQKTMSELERVMKKFNQQADTFRALAKILSKTPKLKIEANICEALAEVADGLAGCVKTEIAIEKDEQAHD